MSGDASSPFVHLHPQHLLWVDGFGQRQLLKDVAEVPGGVRSQVCHWLKRQLL